MALTIIGTLLVIALIGALATLARVAHLSRKHKKDGIPEAEMLKAWKLAGGSVAIAAVAIIIANIAL